MSIAKPPFEILRFAVWSRKVLYERRRFSSAGHKKVELIDGETLKKRTPNDEASNSINFIRRFRELLRKLTEKAGSGYAL
ncbi:MAG: hypothetical protein PVH37_07090 [Desulfobacterales bacterium]|jgi:hypothetical protein